MFAEVSLNRYPLRQLLIPAAEGPSPFGRRGVVRGLSKPDSHLVISEGRNGRLHAANERALKEAQEVIAAAHGRDITSGGLEVHTFREPALDAMFEPVMFLRVKAPSGYAEAVVEDLERRSVRILQNDFLRLDAVIRAEGRLVDLLGVEDAIQTLTNGTAVVWNWLLRYEVTRTSLTAPDDLPRSGRAWFEMFSRRPLVRGQAARRPLFGVLLDGPVSNDDRELA